MTLGGLALAVGILVDEATVEVENIHTQMSRTGNIARAVRLGNAETAVPRLLAMLCILAVFLPSFFMEGSARALFVPLALAVGFAMVTSYFLSSTFVPVLSVWLLKHFHLSAEDEERSYFGRLRAAYARLAAVTVRLRWLVLAAYLGLAGVLVAWWLVGHPGVGTEIFPTVDAGQFQLRLRAATGTRIERTEELSREALEVIKEIAGPENIDISLGYIGTVPSSYPINSVYLWMSGPEEAVLRVSLKRGSGVRVEDLKRRLREELPRRLKDWLTTKMTAEKMTPAQIAQRVRGLRLSFEPADIVNEVMSFGTPTPVEVAVSGPKLADSRAYAARVYEELGKVPALRDLQYVQAFDYPTIEVEMDRPRAGLSKVTPDKVARSVVAATSSSRFTVPSYWRDPNTGIGYQVQVQIPPVQMKSAKELEDLPIDRTEGGPLLLGHVSTVKRGTMPGELDRYNMRRLVSMTANVSGEDLGRVAGHIDEALRAAGEPPRGVTVDVRGQVPPLRQMFRGLAVGLFLAVVVIFLLLTAYFQSLRLALVVVATAPAVIAGVALALLVTGTTLNIQSFMGAIMAVGVAVANAILLVTFAERARREGATATASAVDGGRHRLRPILMTSCAMIAGMVPMALALGEGGEQTAPLGRAVIGGLLMATVMTLLVLPAVFAVVMGEWGRGSASLDPDDPASSYFDHSDNFRPALTEREVSR
jgi:multidrug efflux pump subunit AcrB